MKNKNRRFENHYSDYDNRPVLDPEENLYAGIEYELGLENHKKKLKTERNNEECKENEYFDGQI